MNIILVSDRLVTARSITLGKTHLIALVTAFMLLFLAAVLTVQYAIVRLHPGGISNELRTWLASAQEDEQKKQQAYLHESMDTMAKNLGQLQARLLRLDGLGARLAKIAGMKPQEFSFEQSPPQGGPYVPVPQQSAITPEVMSQQLANLTALLGDRSDKLTALETLLMQNTLNKRLLASAPPVSDGWYSSNFGWRIDPFTGKSAMHEGVDFMVPAGTPIKASAPGVVVFAGYHPEYGNMVEIDHGNDIVTRYAHASKLLTKVGAVVRRGEEIARVGSTGRSTGNHLHFEVRYKGLAQNPARFLDSTTG
jgi:murein DD-endopeptidase MepM/ murein hydrolase activator NlpD